VKRKMIQVGLCAAGLMLMTALSQAATTVAPIPEGDIYPGSIPGAWQMTITALPSGTIGNPSGTLATWLTDWNINITGYNTGNRYCNTCVGEDLDWLFTPIAEGFYYGYMATGKTAYVDGFISWANAMLTRQFMEPDGYPGWPSTNAAGTGVDALNSYYADSFLGDAAAFRVIALMGWQMVNNSGLSGIACASGETTYGATYGATGQYYLNLAETIYNKWMTRGGWRPCDTADGYGPGECTVVLPEGMDPSTNYTTWITNPAGSPNGPGLNSYYSANEYGSPGWNGLFTIGINNGFSHPANKSNEVARWMLAMYDVTGQQQYLTHAQLWFQQMHWRTTTAGALWLSPDSFGYLVWNYWQPNGVWDTCANAAQTAIDNPTGSTGGLKLGSGWVHPNNGYYQLDSLAMAEAWEHGLLSSADISNCVTLSTRDWWGGTYQHQDSYLTPSGLAAGMAVSYTTTNGRNNGTAKLINASWSAAISVISAGSGAFSGTIYSVGSNSLVITVSGRRVTVPWNSSTGVQCPRAWNSMAPYSTAIQTYRVDEESTAADLTGGWDETWDIPYFLMLQAELEQSTGSVHATILPSGAVTAGAQWMLDGGPAWQSSGTTLTGISTGSHKVSFSGVGQWATPATQPVTVTANGTASATGTYTSSPSTYALTVQATPMSDLSITSSTGEGGTTPYAVTTVSSGSSVVLTAPAADPTGAYIFCYWTLNGTAQTAGARQLSFNMPSANTTAVAVYGCYTFILSVQSSGPTGVSISSTTGNSGTTNYTNFVTCEASVNLQAPATDPTGYTFTYWTLNGTAQTAGLKTITFTMPVGNMTAVAVYH
jgi:hypothetical protein